MNSQMFANLPPEERAKLLDSLDSMDDNTAQTMAVSLPDQPYRQANPQQRQQNQGSLQEFAQDRIKSKLQDKGMEMLKQKMGGGEAAQTGQTGGTAPTSGGFHMSGQTGGIVGAAIIAQAMMAESTRKSGRNEGGVLQGKFANDPWQGYVSEKLGLGLTPGEEFDKDPSLGNFAAASHQWAYPGQSMLSEFGTKHLGSTAGAIIDPVGSLLKKL